MNIIINTAIHFGRISLIVLIASAFMMGSQPENIPDITVSYHEDSKELTAQDRIEIEWIINQSSEEVAGILVDLPSHINIEVKLVDADLDQVNGVSGRTDEHDPEGKVLALISKVYDGGPVRAAKEGMKSFIFHEFHHLTRGWSVYQNEFEQGIDNAMVNEGLAVVFAEVYTGISEVVNSYPKEAEKWVREILELPKDANYQTWVTGYHPDGRSFIGYRAGNYLIRTAMEKSGKDILELSHLSPKEIIKMAGY